MKKSTPVPFHRSHIDAEGIRAVTAALKSGWHTMGPQTMVFEEKFRKFVGAHYAIAVNSCTAGLHLALEALGIHEGDEVLVPAMTFTATAEVVCYLKARPVLVDVYRDTGLIDVEDVERKITPRTRAVIAVDYGGQPADYDVLRRIARKHKLYVIADAAHCLPSSYRGKSVGTLADITCFSFYATKTLNTGEGGMVTTANRKWAERMKIMRLHGMNHDAWKRYSGEGRWYYEVVEAGYKYNTTDINAAMGIVQLKKIGSLWKKRERIAAYYTRAFKDIPALITPVVHSDRTNSWHLYVLRLDLEKLRITRNEFIQHLSKAGIGTSVHFIPLYRHPYYRRTFGVSAKGCPQAEWMFQRIISLPVYPGLARAERDRVVDAVRSIALRYQR